MADGITQASGAEVTETLHDRVYEIASRFVPGLSVLDVVIKYLNDSNTEELHAELADTLQFARNHMNAAHNDLDLLSGEIGRAACGAETEERTPEERALTLAQVLHEQLKDLAQRPEHGEGSPVSEAQRMLLEAIGYLEPMEQEEVHS